MNPVTDTPRSDTDGNAIPGLRVNPIEQDFIVHWDQKLGTGVNGPVRPCEEKSTGRKFALKCLLDSARSREEVRIHSLLTGHPHIVSLHHVYHNSVRLDGDATPRSRLFLVMEFMAGGELFDRISQVEYFTEETAANYMSQAVQAVSWLHDKNIAHRDLKPENLLLTDHSENAILKLSDFGFAKKDDGNLMTPRYTPYYVAPQILEAQRRQKEKDSGAAVSPYTYDKSCDLWSLGVVLYIMLCGYPPFYSENPARSLTSHMRNKIMAGDYEFPPNEWNLISEDAKNIIRQLLDVNPANRMSARQLAAHPWLRRTSTSCSSTPLSSPHMLADKDQWDQIKMAYAMEMTQLRMADSPVTLKSMSAADNPMIRKRKHRQTKDLREESMESTDQGVSPVKQVMATQQTGSF